MPRVAQSRSVPVRTSIRSAPSFTSLSAGHAPYLDGTPLPSSKQVLDAVRAGPPRPILLRAGNPFPELVAVCIKAMERDPLARHADAAELAQDLRQWLDGRLVPARPVGTLARIKAWILRDRSPATEGKP